jgi:hypothetical protein
MGAADLNVVVMPEEPKRVRSRMVRAIAARQGLERASRPVGRRGSVIVRSGGKTCASRTSRSHD